MKNIAQIRQEKCHGNSIQAGSCMIMINVNCLYNSLSFDGQKLLYNSDG